MRLRIILNFKILAVAGLSLNRRVKMDSPLDFVAIETDAPQQESDPKDVRCLCGSLMARFLKQGLELKCKRCKRVHLIPFSDIQNDSFPFEIPKMKGKLQKRRFSKKS